MADYISYNKANWDERAELHATSEEYGISRFVGDPAYISDVVRFDRERLGDIRGLSGVHVQCHIGTDTLSLARLGARITGVDFSPKSLEQASLLAERCGASITYVESDVYSETEKLPPDAFDFVYTGIGALCWLPSIEKWAKTVAVLLKPGGRLFIREGHPMMWTIDENRVDALVVRYPYFERAEPMVWDCDATYVETDRKLQASVTHEWNHGLGEIMTALFSHGMRVTMFVEHDSVPWNAFPGQMRMAADGEWRLTEAPWRLPLSYTLQAVKE